MAIWTPVLSRGPRVERQVARGIEDMLLRTPSTPALSRPNARGVSARGHRAGRFRSASKKTEQLYADAEKLHKQLDRYAYGPPQVRFTDDDVDQARAAGVLIEFERGRPIIVDRPLYRELVKSAIKRTHDDLQAKAAAAAKEKKTARANKAPADPITVAKRACAAAGWPASR